VYLLFIILAGCVPFPHTETFTPKINGTLIQNELPQKGTEVVLTEDASCKIITEKSITNEKGEFTLGPITKFRLVLQMEAAYGWNICIREDSNYYPISNFISFGQAPEQVNISCEVKENLDTKRRNWCSIENET